MLRQPTVEMAAKIDNCYRFSQSAAFLLYLGFVLILCLSVLVQGGRAYLIELTIYVLALLLGFVGFSVFLQRFASRHIEDANKTRPALNTLADALLAIAIGYIVVHLLWLGDIPIVVGATINDYYDVMRIRQKIFYDAPALYRYPPNVLLKSLFPFLILYFYVTGRRIQFWLAFAVAALYGAALMNKMFVVIPAVPILIYTLYQRKVRLLGILLGLPCILLALLVFVQNPHIRPEFWTARDQATASGKPLVIESVPYKKNSTATDVNQMATEVKKAAFPAMQFIETIYIRIFLIPGQVVTAWFNNIPHRIDYAHGCGYRVVAALLNCEFRFVPQLIHDIENPALVAEGIKGTMTAANFMEDYANFGRGGLIGSGIMMGFLLALIGMIYYGNWRMAILLNFIPVAMLLELPLTTILFTGGWALTTVLYLLFRSQFNELGAGHEK